MKAAIFQTKNSVFRFSQKEVKEHLIKEPSRYDLDEAAQLAELISTQRSKIIFNSNDHHYFGYVVLDLISEKMGTASCNICRKTYDACQLTQLAIGCRQHWRNSDQFHL